VAGTARYTAVLDANVLFPAFLRDVLLSSAHADMYSARWSEEIEREWKTNLVATYPGAQAAVDETAQAIRDAIPDAMVSGYEHVTGRIPLKIREDGGHSGMKREFSNEIRGSRKIVPTICRRARTHGLWLIRAAEGPGGPASRRRSARCASPRSSGRSQARPSDSLPTD